MTVDQLILDRKKQGKAGGKPQTEGQAMSPEAGRGTRYSLKFDGVFVGA